MKLDGFVTQENAEKGVWFEPELNGKKIGVEFLVIGKDSDIVKKFITEQSRMFPKMTKEEAEQFDINEQARKGVALRIRDMRSTDGQPIVLAGETLTASKASYLKIFEAIPDIQDSIWFFSEKRANFLSKPKKASSEPFESSSSSTSPIPSEKGETDK